ncbi:odorant receptor Or2-like [Anopheles aquasalis]|uniref:odorant receptor Or2-like n=1 Tax=Anopheles aquasalis TaxID=42839 RepID=UPI00215B41DA|nr:odorant receptor Or2-like [Anopheles aquasalis]
MEVLECPLLSVNVRVWRFWSFVLVHNWRRYVSIIPVTLLNVFMFADLYRAWGNIEEVIINAYFAVLYFNAVLRTLILVYQRQKYEVFLASAATVYQEICQIKDDVIRKLVEDYTRRARILSISNLALGAFISGCFVVYPLFTGQRSLPYGMFIPGVSNFESPQYEIFYITQLVLTFPGCCMYIPYTSFFATSTLFGLVQIKTLQHQLRTFRSTGSKLARRTPALDRQLKQFIEDHKRIIRYVQDLNGLVTYICLIEFLSFGLMLCALLFLLNIISVMAQIVIVGAYIFMILTQIFAFYWHSNEVREESMAIATAAYSGPWLEVDNSIKKKLLLITIRAQRPLELTVGNVYPMTLEMFQSLLNASYSYFTLLRRVYN